MDPKHSDTHPGDARDGSEVSNAPKKPAFGDESPAVDSGRSVDETTDQQELAAASVEESQSSPPSDAPAAELLPEVKSESDDKSESLDFQDALDAASSPELVSPIAVDAGIQDAQPESDGVSFDSTAVDSLLDSPGPPSESADGSSQPVAPEIVKPWDEWPWENPLGSFQPSPIETDFEVADAAFSPTADSGFNVTGHGDWDSATDNDSASHTSEYYESGPPLSAPDDNLVLSAGHGSNATADRGPTFDSNPSPNPLLQPTSDGGPPLARPMVLLSLTPDDTRRLIEEALRAASEQDARTMTEIAEFKVNERIWIEECQMRAIFGNY